MSTKKKPKGPTAAPQSSTPAAAPPTAAAPPKAAAAPSPAAAHNPAEVALKPAAATPAAKPLSFAEMAKKAAAAPTPTAAPKAPGGTGGAAAPTSSVKATTAAAPPAAAVAAAEPEFTVKAISGGRRKHILDRHGPESTATDAGHFYEGWSEIEKMIWYAVENGTYYDSSKGPPGYEYECDCGESIGENINGYDTSWIRVKVSKSGEVITAFPF